MQTTVTYRIEALPDNKTKFVWLLYLDPGAQLSPKMMNKRMSRYALKDLRTLKKMAQQ